MINEEFKNEVSRLLKELTDIIEKPDTRLCTEEYMEVMNCIETIAEQCEIDFYK